MAAALKELIVGAFPGAVDIFVSSDAETIAYGTRWPDKIEDALRSIASVTLSPPPPQSLTSRMQWIANSIGRCRQAMAIR